MQKVGYLLLAMISLPTLAESHFWRGQVGNITEVTPWTVTLRVMKKEPTISDYRTPKDTELVCENITFRFDIQSDSLVDALRHKMTKLNYKHDTQRAMHFLEQSLSTDHPFHFKISPNQSTSTRLIGCEINFSRLHLGTPDNNDNKPVITFYNNASF
ncbi:hypothetical protein L4C36_15730 [Photobacterium japonica]|uniref:hypothetical protein n=1 Tax=Photobacterium japonica TaxID=2910235 RepID=UPI003D0A4507